MAKNEGAGETMNPTPTNPSPQALMAAHIIDSECHIITYDGQLATIIDREFAPLIAERDRLRKAETEIREVLYMLRTGATNTQLDLRLSNALAALQQTEDGK